MGKECFEEKKHLFYYKDIVPIGPLGMVDDLLTITECGFKTELMNQFLNFKTGSKRLQFGTDKCIKMHVGKSGDKILCKDLHIGGWKVDVLTDPKSGLTSNSEYFSGYVQMKVKEDQTYLGDLISSDGSHSKKVQERSNKGQGIINQIMNILETTYFGKYYFEIAMVLRQSLFLSSILLNSEAWVNYSEKDIRILERCDEILLSKILGSDSNSSNAMKYLDLGVAPLRFEIMKRKLSFLQYILQQNKDTMLHQVVKATWDNPLNNDFVMTCKKYLEVLEINLTFEEIQLMSKFSFSQIVKKQMKIAAFAYLKAQQQKQDKIKSIIFTKLEMQDYLANGDRNINVSKLIFKARGETLDIKLQKRWKYEDVLCSGCKNEEDLRNEILRCKY